MSVSLGPNWVFSHSSMYLPPYIPQLTCTPRRKKNWTLEMKIPPDVTHNIRRYFSALMNAYSEHIGVALALTYSLHVAVSEFVSVNINIPSTRGSGSFFLLIALFLVTSV